MPLEEKIEILVFLCSDDDQAIRETAFKTLQTWDAQELRQVLSSPSTPLTLLDFAVGYLAAGRKEVREALLENPQLPDDLREWVRSLEIRPELDASSTAAPAPPTNQPPEDLSGPGRETLLQRIAHMNTAEKIKTALTGSQEERLALIRDSNKIVTRAVLQSPKLSEQEIENFASMKNVTEEVLRLIATNRKFMKSYVVLRALLNNPRAPLDISIRLVNHLNDRDLKGLSLNKNVPETLRAIALKLIRQKIEAQKVKISTKH